MEKDDKIQKKTTTDYVLDAEPGHYSIGSGKSHGTSHATAVGSVMVALPPTILTTATRVVANLDVVWLCQRCRQKFRVLGEEGYCESCLKIASAIEGEWFRFISFCIPRMISEPWLGDLREHRVRMVNEGYSRTGIEWATAIEVTLLLLSWLIDAILNILTPFKPGR